MTKRNIPNRHSFVRRRGLFILFILFVIWLLSVAAFPWLIISKDLPFTDSGTNYLLPLFVVFIILTTLMVLFVLVVSLKKP